MNLGRVEFGRIAFFVNLTNLFKTTKLHEAPASGTWPNNDLQQIPLPCKQRATSTFELEDTRSMAPPMPCELRS